MKKGRLYSILSSIQSIIFLFYNFPIPSARTRCTSEYFHRMNTTCSTVPLIVNQHIEGLRICAELNALQVAPLITHRTQCTFRSVLHDFHR